MKKYEFLTAIERKERFSGSFMNETIFFENGFELSIQASRYNYCQPREDYEDINLYNKFEIACFFKERWLIVNVPNVEIYWEISPFVISGKKGYFFADEYNIDTAIAGYVRKKDVEAVYQYLKRIKKVKTKKVFVEKHKNEEE